MTAERDGDGTHVLTPALRELRHTRYRLTVVGGPDLGLEHVSEGCEVGVGTAPGNQLVLHDPTVSRHHFVVSATPRGHHLRDVASTNGTLVGGLRVDGAYLKSGLIIGVGITTLRFDELDSEIREPLSEADRFDRVLGRSPAMRRIFALLPRVAAVDSTVLLEGETGTGKSLLAEAIHAGSARARGPFIVVDCGAIPPTLIESELFGHEKGAFTGAHAARPGAFQAANGGTIFLDEIGELPLAMQPKLLRALEERAVKPVGGTAPVRLDVRVIAATNRDLRQEVNRGAFRSDLYYRLDVIHLAIPPLRERREDIPQLVAHFYEQFVGEGAIPPQELVDALAPQSWQGNVRELRTAIERAVFLGHFESVSAADVAESVPDASDFTVSFREAKERALGRWEKGYVRELVQRGNGNLTRAARLARMDRNHLRELLQKYGLRGARDES